MTIYGCRGLQRYFINQYCTLLGSMSGIIMLIAIFASRETQRQYAVTLSRYVEAAGGNKTLVLWYKDLGRLIFWIKALFCPKSKDLSNAVEELILEKKNSPKWFDASNAYWYVFKQIKTFESKLLYITYSEALVKNNINQLVIWNGLKFRQKVVTIAAKDLEIPCHFIERGAFPNTTTLDSQGINFINSVPRDPSFYMKRDIQPFPIGCRFDSEKPECLPDNYIFVPFQVNIDSQITLFSPWIKNMFSLVDQLLHAEIILGDEMPHIILKSHPACAQSYESLRNKVRETSQKIFFVDEYASDVLIKYSDAVMTINSSVGMEGLLMRKKVIVLGQAFYDIKGITLSSESLEEMILNLHRVQCWYPNEYLLSSFLDYLKYEYVVEGSWHAPTNYHLKSMSDRLTLLSNNQQSKCFSKHSLSASVSVV